MANNTHWGYHLMVDCHDCDRDMVTNPERIKKFCKELVKKIDMVAYGEPQVVHFAEHDIEKAGWTLVQLIETSNICAHMMDDSGDMYLDVFSCKLFDQDTVIKIVKKYFKPKNHKIMFLTRDATPSRLK